MAQEPETARGEGITGAPLYLGYATPNPKQVAGDEVAKLLHVGRRLVFALGVGLLMYGIGDGCATRRGDAPTFMGWGAALVALVMPWGWRRTRRTED